MIPGSEGSELLVRRKALLPWLSSSLSLCEKFKMNDKN